MDDNYFGQVQIISEKIVGSSSLCRGVPANVSMSVYRQLFSSHVYQVLMYM